MSPTKSTEEVLEAIERDLREDERLREDLRRDVAALGPPPRRRVGLLVASVAVMALLVAGSFALGWFLAPGSGGGTAAATGGLSTIPASSLIAKQDGLRARYGPEFGETLPTCPYWVAGAC